MTDTATIKSKGEKIDTFRAPASKWWQAAGFLLLLSLVGLGLYPILLLAIIFVLWRWGNDRYAFLVEVMILFGSFGFTPTDTLPTPDIGLALGILGYMIYRKNKTVKWVTVATLLYIFAVILIAMTSIESMSVQIFRMRRYWTIIIFFVPLLVFANKPFDWIKFRNQVVIHALVICGFYVIDTFIINGYILLPCTGFGGTKSTIYDPELSGLFSLPRHYPPGLYWLIPCVIWLNYKQIRFSTLQWLVIALALFAARTNSLLFALVVCWIIFRPQTKQIITYGITAAVLLCAGYLIDGATGRNLRLADNIDQFITLDQAETAEDYAEFGTGRVAQIIPKWILLEEMDRVALGFGFIHPEKTTNPIFQIHNEFYTDGTQADEIATEVEVTQVQTIFDIGVLGLIIQLAFYIGVYFIIRRLDHSHDYLNVIVGASVLGIGGFAGFNSVHGQCLIGTILGAILAANKPLSIKLLKKSEQP